ncbi:MAG: hypothetical protein ACXWQJ_14070 [Bdellovibrionota bacterium]
MIVYYFMALCAIGCSYEGYDTGKYIERKCACINYYEPADFTLKKIKKAAKKPKRQAEEELD